MCHELVQVFGKSVVVVAGCWLTGLTKASAVIGDDTVTCFQKNWHLLLPGSTAQWISVNRDDWITGDVLLIVEIDVAGVFLADINVWHLDSPFYCVWVGVDERLGPEYFGLLHTPRTISDKNQVRRSVWSIQVSIKLAVATSPCSSQTWCVERKYRVRAWLSARSSDSISLAATSSSLLSFRRWCREMSLTDRRVVPPILRARSAISSVMAKICSPCSSTSRW